MTNKFDCTIVEDNDFLSTDVSELVKGDYYLFHLTNDKMCIYKDGVVCVNSIDLKMKNNITVFFIQMEHYKISLKAQDIVTGKQIGRAHV